MNKDINDFKKLSYIKLEIIPAKGKYNKFINFDDKNKSHYHIYFNNDKNEEISSTYIKPENKVEKIRIQIDHEITSLKELFKDLILLFLIRLI